MDQQLITVASASDWVQVNEALWDFEDGVIRDVWLESGNWLMPGDGLAMSGGWWRVVVLVHLQGSPTRAVLLRFEDVTQVSFEGRSDVFPARAVDSRTGWQAEFLSCRIAASRCTVELVGDEWLGRGPFLLNPVVEVEDTD